MRALVIILSFCLIFSVKVYADVLSDGMSKVAESTSVEKVENGAYDNSFETNFSQNEQVNEIDANTRDSDGKLLVMTYSEKNKFGLKKSDGEIITKAIYKKLIRLGDKSWIVQYKNKYGLIDYKGDYIILPKYRNVQRIANRYVKFGNDNDYGLYDENGFTIIQPEYSSIDLLYGRMFLTCKNFRYGVVDMDGNTLLQNEYEDIYMPSPSVMMVQYEGNWCKIESVSENEITLPYDIEEISKNSDFKMTNLVVNTGVGAGYSVVTLTDYILKIFTSFSPAYEATIDELMYSQGADTLSILMKFAWIPKFPVVFIKQYYRQLRRPNKSPLANTRNSIKKQLR